MREGRYGFENYLFFNFSSDPRLSTLNELDLGKKLLKFNFCLGLTTLKKQKFLKILKFPHKLTNSERINTKQKKLFI